MRKGQKASLEARRRMSEAKLKKPVKYWLGKHFGEEHNSKLTKAKVGRKPPSTAFKKGGKPWNKGMTVPQLTGERNGVWRGNDVSYFALHSWVSRQYGNVSECVYCGSDENLNWANISKEYKRDLLDWLRLCRKCHHAFDGISSKIWSARRSYV